MFNPLDHLNDTRTSVSSAKKVSTSSLEFSSEENCPKCGKPFEAATAAMDISVRYCPNCRVATPFRD